MGHRHALAVLLVVALLVAACQGDAATTTSTDQPTTTTVSTTTSTTRAPSSTTSSSPPPACDAGDLPDGLEEVAWVLADADGDGEDDRLVAYREADTAVVRIEPAAGGSVEAEIMEDPGPLPVEPIGGHDLDGDGTDELFVTVGAGAYTFLVGAWTLDGCELRRVTLDGLPAAFPVGASASNVVGLRCPDDGGLETVSASYVDEETYEGGFQPYELDGSELVAGPFAPAVFHGDEILDVARFACGDFSLDTYR
jgi:hypothetical protein